VTAALETGFAGQSHLKFVRQTEIAECGLACLAMVASHYGLVVDLGSLRRRFEPSMRGISLKSLIAIADQIGLAGRPVRLPLDRLVNLAMPAILHWDLNHFVVLESIRGGKALVHDPAGRSRRYTLDEVSDHFTGVALELHPVDGFEPADVRERLRLSQLWRRISGLKRALLQTLVLSIVLQAFVLASPYYMQIAIDQALPALDRDLLSVLALGFGLFVLINAAASFLRSHVLLSAGTALSFGVTGNVARRLLRLPIAWFEKRHVGDILSRFQSIVPIQQALTQGAVAALVDGALAMLTLVLMIFYSAALAVVAVAAFTLYLVVRLVSFAPERDAREEVIVAAANEQSVMIESIRGITTLRLFNRETARHSLWYARLADAMNANVAFGRIGIWQTTANALISGIETIVTIWIAIRLVMAGGFSIGMVFAYIAYKTQFLSKAISLTDQAIAFRMLSLHLERLSDIAMAPEDESMGPSAKAHTPLVGRIELRDVAYRYSPNDPTVLNGVSLTVEPGDHVAITGVSGGGKSTLVKILLGLVEPTAGTVAIDGLPLARFGHKSFHDQIGAVLQEDALFAGTLAENIALFDDAPDMDRIRTTATAAAIHGDIEAMPMGYDTLVGDMGSSLSGGQKQRVLLARALYRRPKLLVLDEGTSHLDRDHERAVNLAIADMGITRIVVAHRAETIAAARRVFVLQDGTLVERDRSSGGGRPHDRPPIDQEV